ncbi:uncharacterized protein LOC124926563 [Impatiens glandulifera]|uniref:uncharacterized protein LOC124926563 n=1 Tax=Impatiens glandulifera TaxID=253017 RepID=UPI001FB09C97|nr:uncharacterized protein LOC124926563 [Impatiens glandulifera]XP_047322769.1 uncharacterized protein LOC124926563 [Impatiens glandulifera]
MEMKHLSTLLSMDSSSSSHEEIERVTNHFEPPDINVPLSVVEPIPLPLSWNSTDVFDIDLLTQLCEGETNVNVTKAEKKCAKRIDSFWGAWFFFNFYFKPVLKEKSKSKLNLEGKPDLNLDVFLVQHDMENMYMWVFKERPENALGKMQLRSFMNGHSRQGERPFPFPVEKGFIRSHRMQRKHYKGLSNPQCLHGIRLVLCPNLINVEEDDINKWLELTGRDLNFSVPSEAIEFCLWRNNLPSIEFELDHTSKRNNTNLNLSTHSPNHNKRQRNHLNGGFDIHQNEPNWFKDFTGVMRNADGPVTAAKTIYEDEKGFLIIVSLPFIDLQKVKVTWKNTISHGIVKVSCLSSGCVPIVKRQNRTFKLTDPMPEQCPQGEFVREIPLSMRIPEEAKLEAYCDQTGKILEIMVPKQKVGLEEHEVTVCVRPSLTE